MVAVEGVDEVVGDGGAVLRVFPAVGFVCCVPGGAWWSIVDGCQFFFVWFLFLFLFLR